MKHGTDPTPTVAQSVGWTITATTTLSTAIFGWYAMWSSPINGDEAYLLVSLREWVIRGGLYNRVYSQYGPFYYFAFGLPSRIIGADWTFAAGRLTSLVLWIVSAFLFGVAVRAITRSWIFGVAAQLLSFSVLNTLVNEPMHPGALLNALLAALLANVAWMRPRAPRTSDAVSGALAAALLLTKVNVGLFTIVAIASVAAWGARRDAWQWTTSVVLVSLAPILLLANGQESWRLLWSAVFVSGAFAIVMTSLMNPGTGALHVRMAAIGFGIIALVSIGTMFATGTGVTAVVRGALLRPLSHPHLVTIALELPVAAWLWLLVPPAAIALRRWRPPAHASSRAFMLSGAGRVVAGAALTVSILGPESVMRPIGSRLSLIPLVALVLVPRISHTVGATDLLARRFLALSALTESLHAYPVPGSQVSWSVVIAGLAAVVVVADGVSELSALASTADRMGVARLAGASLCIGMVLVFPRGAGSGITAPGAQLHRWSDAYDHSAPLHLNGSGWLRAPASARSDITNVVRVIRNGCDTFVTLGAGLSWYLLVGQRPPTGFNQPAWPAFLNGHEQNATVTALGRGKRICLVLSGFGGGFRDGRVVAFTPGHSRPLVRYLERTRWTILGRSASVQVLRAINR